MGLGRVWYGAKYSQGCGNDLPIILRISKKLKNTNLIRVLF